MKVDLPKAPSKMPSIYKESVIIDLLYNTTDTPEHFKLARDSGLTVMQHSVTSLRADTPLAFKEMAEMRNIIDDNSEVLCFAGKAADIRQAKTDGKLAVLMGTQNPKFVQDEIHYLRAAHEIGLRVLMLTHNQRNYIGGGCAERDDGLTDFGKKVVRECNRIGMLIDVSHCGPRTTLDAIEYSELPIITTHSAPRSQFPSVRNKTDEEIVKLAEKGGVFGVLSWGGAIYRDPARRPTLSDVLDAYDYLIRLVGPEHVAIGTDTNENKFLSRREMWDAEFGPRGKSGHVIKHLAGWYNVETWYAEGTGSVTQLPDLAQGLLDRGHGEEAVKLVLGESTMRLLEQVIG